MTAPKRHTFSQLAVHVTFSTTGRMKWIDHEIERRLWAELRRILEDNRCKVWAVGGVEDHVHVLFELPPALALATILQRLKGGSSRWFRLARPDTAFSWQRGYGAFSVSARNIDGVVRYIQNQREHHMRFDYDSEIERLVEDV
jgi:REP element-mobilizing transposase RayT